METTMKTTAEKIIDKIKAEYERAVANKGRSTVTRTHDRTAAYGVYLPGSARWNMSKWVRGASSTSGRPVLCVLRVEWLCCARYDDDQMSASNWYLTPSDGHHIADREIVICSTGDGSPDWVHLAREGGAAEKALKLAKLV